MIFHSDYKKFGFRLSEITALLEENNISLKTPSRTWPVEYQQMPAFTKQDAALIMSGLFPDEVDDWRFWDDPPSEVDRKLRLIDACQHEILAQDARLNGFEKPKTEIGSVDRISHAAWRNWSKEKGLDWPIPDSTESTAPPKTDEELLRRLSAEEGRRKKAEADAEILRAQVSDLQKKVDQLNRLVGDGSAIALHNTRLMKIALAVQREYWTDVDQRPNQEALWGDLREKYKLSQLQAEAVELVACPIDRQKKTKK